MRWAIIGAGRAAASFSSALLSAGHCVVSVWARRPSAAEALAARRKADPADLSDAARHANAVLVAVADGAISEVAQRLAPHAGAAKLWVHLAGSLPASVLLEATAAAGGGTALAFHPLAILTGADRDLHGVTVALDGDSLALKAGRQLAADFGAAAVAVQPALRPPYHLAATFMAGHLLGAALAARDMCRTAGLPAEVESGLFRLAQEALTQAQAGGDAAITGPVARGDLATVRAHLTWLREHGEDRTAMEYAALSRLLLSFLSSSQGRTDVARLLDLVDGGGRKTGGDSAFTA